MTGYLTHLVERALGLIPTLQPQPRSRYEQPPETPYEPGGVWPEPGAGVWREPGTGVSLDPGPGMPLGPDLFSGIGPHGLHDVRRPTPSPQPTAGTAGPRSEAVPARPTPGPEPTFPDLRNPTHAAVAQRLPAIAEVDDRSVTPAGTGTTQHIYAPRESFPSRRPRADPPETVPDAASVQEATVEAESDASPATVLPAEHTGQMPRTAVRPAHDPTGRAGRTGPLRHETDEPPPPRGPLITGRSAPSDAPTPRTPPSTADHASGPHPPVAPPAHHAAQFPRAVVRDALPSMSPASMNLASMSPVETPPRVVVNIGRVEVRTRQKTAPPDVPSSGQARQTPAERGAQPLSLGDYLASRAEKGMGPL